MHLIVNCVRQGRRLLLTALLLSGQISMAGIERQQRQHIHVVGSSTAFPIVASSAEYFGRHTSHPTPVVESTGTGGGFKLFCAGIGSETPDIAMASRRMKLSERDICEQHGVYDIREIKIGFDGIVIAGKKGAPDLRLQPRDVYLSLARWVPAPARSATLIANPYQTWRDIRSELPDMPIRVYGPPPTSGTRDILVERLISQACLQETVIQELLQRNPMDVNRVCQTLREDGAFINAGENDSKLVRKLINDPQALGIFGFNFLDRNRDILQGASMSGVAPRFEAIESGDYPLTRPLYLYVKFPHKALIPGLSEFTQSVIEPQSAGPEGRLTLKGLIPLDAPARTAVGAVQTSQYHPKGLSTLDE